MEYSFPKVSILIPLYNAESYIGETLESALAQTWPNKEIIVVDDGSKDNSLAIVRSFEKRGVKVLSQMNKGAAAARNHAFRESKGAYVQYLDADDLLHSKKIEVQMNELRGESIKTLASGRWGNFTNNLDKEKTIFFKTPASPADSATPYKYTRPVDWLVCSWNRGGSMQTAAWLTSRELCLAAGEWNEQLVANPNDDGEYFCRVILKSDHIKFCEEAKVYYRTHSNERVSQTNTAKKINSLYRSLELCSIYLLEAEDSPVTRQAAANLFQEFIYNFYGVDNQLVHQAEQRGKDFGGGNIKYRTANPLLETISVLLGWKIAVRIKSVLNNVKLRS